MVIAAVNAPVTPRAPVPSGGGRVIPGNFGNPRPVNPLPSNVVPGNFGGPRPVNPPPPNVVQGNFGGNPRPVNPVAQPGTYTGPRPVNATMPRPSSGIGGQVGGGIVQAAGEAATKEFFDWAYPKADLPPGAVGPLPGPEIPNPARDGLNPDLADALGIPETIPGPSLPIYPNQTDPGSIPAGPMLTPGQPAQPGEPGSRAIPYNVTYTNPATVTYSTGEVIQGGTTSMVYLGVRTGPLSIRQEGNPSEVFLYHAAGRDSLGAGNRVQTLPQFDWRTQSYITVTITTVATPQVFPTAVDGSAEPAAQPEIPPEFSPNPARARPRGVPVLPRPNLPPGADPLPFPFRAPTPSPNRFPFAPPAPAPRTNPDPTAPPSPARPLDPKPAPTPTPNPNPQPRPNPTPNPSPTPNFDPETPTLPTPQRLPEIVPSRPPLNDPWRVTPQTPPFSPGINPPPFRWPSDPAKVKNPTDAPPHNTPINPDLGPDPTGNPWIEIVPEIIRQTRNPRNPGMCRYDSKNIAGKCDKIQDLLDDNLKPTYQGQINLSPCPVGEDPPQDIRSAEDQGIPGIDAKLNLALDGIAALWELLRCGPGESDGVAIPETWNLKKSISVNQMVIVTKPSGDGSPTYRRSFTIPHPRYIEQKDIELRKIKRFKYRRGSFQATIQLSDNSCCVLNCFNRAEAKRTAQYVLSLIHPAWARTAVIKITEKINLEIDPVPVEFHVAKYYSSSDDRFLPVWSLPIP